MNRSVKVLVSLFLCIIAMPFFLNAQEAFEFKGNKLLKTEQVFKVMIDPGHGGFDPGKIGVSGVYEKDINLDIAKHLKSYLENHQIEVVMTRESDEDLDGLEGKAHKSKDMQKRKELINESEANILISIHQNAFTDASVKGFQVFYYQTSLDGEKLARYVDEALKEGVNANNRRKIKSTEHYYVLKVTQMPSVIVECGFLSNKEEESLLQTEAYRIKVAHAIGEGILKYFSEVNLQQKP
jgi:N-acetylmuramoyl-L-alanine amidase